eukprot:6477358-Amphidinium_carterae.1
MGNLDGTCKYLDRGSGSCDFWRRKREPNTVFFIGDGATVFVYRKSPRQSLAAGTIRSGCVAYQDRILCEHERSLVEGESRIRANARSKRSTNCRSDGSIPATPEGRVTKRYLDLTKEKRDIADIGNDVDDVGVTFPTMRTMTLRQRSKIMEDLEDFKLCQTRGSTKIV